jgi:hypothetical protein
MRCAQSPHKVSGAATNCDIAKKTMSFATCGAENDAQPNCSLRKSADSGSASSHSVSTAIEYDRRKKFVPPPQKGQALAGKGSSQDKKGNVKPNMTVLSCKGSGTSKTATDSKQGLDKPGDQELAQLAQGVDWDDEFGE